MFYILDACDEGGVMVYDSSDGTCGNVSLEDVDACVRSGVTVKGTDISNGEVHYQPYMKQLFGVKPNVFFSGDGFMALVKVDGVDYWKNGLLYEFDKKEQKGSKGVTNLSIRDRVFATLNYDAKDTFIVPCKDEIVFYDFFGSFTFVSTNHIDRVYARQVTSEAFKKYVSMSKVKPVKLK